MKNIIYTSIAIILLTSCETEQFSLDKDDLNIIPYEGNEVLVLESREKKLDTIFLNGYEDFYKSAKRLSLFPTDKFETYYIKASIFDINYKDYTDYHVLVELVQARENTNLTFSIKIQDISCFAFFGDGEFEKLKFTDLTIKNKIYNDVKIIEMDKDDQDYVKNADRFYWSLNDGFLGFDYKKLQYRLIKKYTP